MNQHLNFGLSWATAAFFAAATVGLSAQQPTQGTGGQTAKPAGQTQTQKPAPGTQKPDAGTQTAKPSTQKPAMAQESGGAVSLGTVRIPRAVKAGGESLPAGTYQLRVTEQQASPAAPGQTPQYERWAEFLRGGKVVAREVVTVVPGSDIKQVAEMNPPPAGGSRTDVLKGNDYLRLWVNRGGNHYLVHFPM